MLYFTPHKLIKMKKVLTLLFITQTTLWAWAQRNCGAMEHLHESIQKYPSLLIVRDEIEEFTRTFIEQGGAQDGNRAVITIPVVVHVIYNTTAQNISDAQIQSQLTVLNNDFRKLNSDWANTPSAWQSLVADVEVQFCLAQRDPSGNATNGIVRRQTTVTSFSTNDAMKYTAQGGSNAWPASSYLNIWVCNLGGGLLGYAQFPGGPSATDGVVVNFTAFGTTGTAAAPFNRGRTATHEVGHWLNLYHIWGDDGTGCTGSDNVNDTPNQADENYGCPAFPTVSCSNGPNGDMFMNYMDYTDDACMYMFTAGQKARMQALFAAGGFRASLVNSLGCQAPSGGTTCGTPSSLSASSVTQTSAVLSWAAVSGATSYNVQYKTAAATTWTTTSTTGTSLSLSGLAAATTYNYQVQAVCSGTSGSYSTASSFTTQSAATTCTDVYESNNSINTSKAIAVNTNITALIGSSSDNDYFRFSNSSSQRNIQVTLSNLPADYDLRLYNSKGQLLGTSQNGGTASEGLKYNNAPVGTYYARVYGYNGAFNTSSCYTLRAAISSTAFKMEDMETNDSGKPLAELEYNLYPNPAAGEATVDVFLSDKVERLNIRVFDMLGNVVFATEVTDAEGAYQQKIDLSGRANGIYLVAIETPSGTKTQKLVLSR